MLTSILSMAGLSILFAGILAFADKKLKVEEHPKVEAVNKLLPGVNCGACGFLSCHDFAEHIVTDGADPAKCRVISEETREELCEIMGVEGGEVFPTIALVHCAAEEEHKEPVADYNGVKTCNAAALDFGAGMQCEYGCMGFGDCKDVCPFDAIVVEKGLPRIDIKKCTGCGNCVEACPRHIISVQEKKFKKLFYVACNSKDTILRTRQVCKVGCMACGVCVKAEPKKGYFKVVDNLSIPDYSKQKDQKKVGEIAGKCPTKAIKEV